MHEVFIETEKPYKVVIENGLIDLTGRLLLKIKSPCKAVIISDVSVSKLYADRLIASLKSNGYEPLIFVFNDGEKSKNLTTVNNIYNFLYENKVRRSDLIISLGGGVCGDIAGFCASTYLRSIDYIHIPTSLLAQIDSSIGGKTGINLNNAKNLVGTFYQPKMVITDPNLLLTLQKRFYYDGMAEAIKYACIKSSKLFSNLLSFDYKIEDIILECVKIKSEIVACDEKDSSIRMLLNFGHTIGHALEKIYNYDKLTHGEAIAIGMAMITKISENLSLTKKGTFKKVKKILELYKLSTSDNSSITEIFNISINDKKNFDNSMNLILIKEIGNGFIYKIDENKFHSFLEAYYE